MLFTTLFIAAFAWVFFVVLRATWIAITGPMVEQGREIPMSFALRRAQYPAGDDFVLGLGVSLWRVPDPSRPPGGGAAPTTAPVTRVGYKLGRDEFWLGPMRIERRIDGRAKVESGTLAITAQRLAFRGKSETVDIPLADIAGFDVRGPLLELKRRSRPNDPVAFKVPAPVLLAKLVQSLATRRAPVRR
jgi:hypothetical protein